MAPRAAKRTATAPVTTASRARKVAKLTPQQEQLQAVACALEGMAELPSGCRAMLLAALPASLGSPKDTRHMVQDQVVSMIGEALVQVRSAKEASVAQAGESATTAEARRAELQAARSSAESALEGKTKIAQERKYALDVATAALVDAKAVLASRQQQEQVAKDAEAAQRAECAAFDDMVGGHFAPLKEGAWEVGANAGLQHIEALEATLLQAKLDSSVMASLRISGSKQASERTNFDNMVLEQVGSSLADKADGLRKELADKGPSLAESSAAVAAQAAEVGKAEAAMQECKTSFEQTDAERHDRDNLLQAAAQELKVVSAEAKKVSAALEAARVELELFVTGPQVAFETLRDATSKIAEAAAEASVTAEDTAVSGIVGGA